MSTLNQYFPQSTPHPGETLVEKLEEIQMGTKEFAISTGKPEKTIIAILKGKCSITPEMAVLFESVLSIPARFWMENQRQYDEYIARRKRKTLLNEAIDWSKKFPFTEMVDLGWVNESLSEDQKIEELFRFYRLSNKAAWENYYFRKKLKLIFPISLEYAENPYALSAWLRQGEIMAEKQATNTFNANRFKTNLKLVTSFLEESYEDFFTSLQQLCLQAGVKLVFVPALTGVKATGSTRWIKGTSVIQLSQHANQNFWFVFFHTAGHILLHGKKYLSIENINSPEVDPMKEEQANRFAQQWLTISSATKVQ